MFFLFGAQHQLALGAFGEVGPRLLRSQAALAHMLERRRFRLDSRLFGPVEQELKV